MDSPVLLFPECKGRTVLLASSDAAWRDGVRAALVPLRCTAVCVPDAATARAGIEAGVPAADCREMVEATMLGTARQLLDGGEHPRLYMEHISSPGGTTIAALRAMEGDVFYAITDAVDAALARTRELAGK